MKRSGRQVPRRRGGISRAAVSVVGLIQLTLAGCAAVGPNYQAPQPDAREQWSVKANTRTPDPTVLTAWWQQFGDPVLDSLVTDAMAANLDLATARAQLREARAQRKLAGAQLGPSIDASISGSRSKSSSQSGTGISMVSELYSTGFDASWELDVFGGLRRGVEAADADVGATIESLHDTQVSLVAEVGLNYVDLRTAERRLAIAEANIASLGETYDLTRWRQEAGLVSELDVAQAQTELERTRASLPSLRTTAANASNRLAVLLGIKPGALRSRLAPTSTIPLLGREIAVGIPADTLRHRPDVRAAERKLAAETARLGKAEAARYPSFDLSGSLGLEALTPSKLANPGAVVNSLLASITAPIFYSGRISANIEIQDAKLEQARISYRAAVLTALEDVENALVALTNVIERRDRLAQATNTARQALRLAEQRYASGLVDFLTVLDSRRTLQDLEDQLTTSAGDLATAQVQLYKALGGGWSRQSERDPIRNDT